MRRSHRIRECVGLPLLTVMLVSVGCLEQPLPANKNATINIDDAVEQGRDISPEEQAQVEEVKAEFRRWERYYPVHPGTPQWAELRSFGEMIAATQLPEDVAASLPTDELLEACLHYPLLGAMMSSNSTETGFDGVRSNFNGFQHLFARPDVGRVALSRYSAMRPQDLSSDWTMVRQGRFVRQFGDIETILAQEPVLSALNQDELPQLMQVVLAHTRHKEELKHVFGMRAVASSAFVAGRIMSTASFAPFTNNTVLRQLEPELMLKQILESAERYVDQAQGSQGLEE